LKEAIRSAAALFGEGSPEPRYKRADPRNPAIAAKSEEEQIALNGQPLRDAGMRGAYGLVGSAP